MSSVRPGRPRDREFESEAGALIEASFFRAGAGALKRAACYTTAHGEGNFFRWMLSLRETCRAGHRRERVSDARFTLVMSQQKDGWQLVAFQTVSSKQ